MIVKSAKKKDASLDIKFRSIDRTCHSLERKNHIKYLGVTIDDSMSWKYHMSYICVQISHNTWVISKLRHYLSIKKWKQLNYNLFFPYMSYACALIPWGSTLKTHFRKVQVKQNHIIRLIFFTTPYGKETESAKPLKNLLV